ncbi:MAG TPA: phosphoribosyltransferase family protein [Drouetiella sp.]|jgi:putative phosphoribosyl transferase
MLFKNRKQAGQQLAAKIEEHFSATQAKADDVVVAGLPRGGVIVALEVSRLFHRQVDVIVSKKIAYPGQPDFAIGAVSSDDVIVLNPDIPHNLQWQHYINQQHVELLEFSRNLENEFYEQAGYSPSRLENKTVIIVDDGIATGMTAAAALKTARLRSAKAVLLAAPVMSRESIKELAQYCDAIIHAYVPDRLEAVGQHYIDFTQVSNAEVIAAMKESTHFNHVPGLNCAHQPKG